MKSNILSQRLSVALIGLAAAGVAMTGCSGGGSEAPANQSAQQATTADTIRLNQHGYAPAATKRATIVSESKSPLTWQIMSADEQQMISGVSQVFGADGASGEHLHQIDFSALQLPGHYRLDVAEHGSREVSVKTQLFDNLYVDSARFYYFHRMGEPVLADYLHDPKHAHDAIHPTDNALPCFDSWCGDGVTLNVKNTWYDAGDFGAYPVNAAISAWTLLNAYEFGARVFEDDELTIPESGNGTPDLLDEIRFGSTFMAGMLPPEGQLASHKIHNQEWSGFEGDIVKENAMERYAQPPSTAATYAVARNAAHLARVFLPYDESYAQQQWQVANDAWQRAESNPVVYYSSDTVDSNGGGDYDDNNVVDDRYAAAAELWISATVLADDSRESFASTVRQSPDFLTFDDDGAQQWQWVQGAGSLSLWLHREAVGLTVDEIATLEGRIETTATLAAARLQASGYPMLYNPTAAEPEQIWPWGSNSFVLNRMIVLAYAHQITGDIAKLENMHQGMDYLLGNNPLNLSFITGYGQQFEEDLHDRIGFPLLRDQGVAFPPGWVAGGPLTGWKGCDSATPETVAPAKRYGPAGTAPEAWCSKEVAINWNSPLVWVSAYLSVNPLN
ncbi:glycoside hydrolase family 9 protein [Neiella marina]|uniref:Glycoside hydrolase family 9 protein n=1 Tax=Neiella holothuriorum TaxID=2870530 RepID=A0ABS7EJX3_9GAMM|nr:glycoside hydrolase family 9 protein [Neiella holothuriorum]MBW8192654.1 glycoside hydrolase family 9 protein [Neiella holothuriorum]